MTSDGHDGAAETRVDALQVGDVFKDAEEEHIIVIGVPIVEETALVLVGRRVYGATSPIFAHVYTHAASTVAVSQLLFGCPRCLRISANEMDRRNRFCGACHIFWPRFDREDM